MPKGIPNSKVETEEIPENMSSIGYGGIEHGQRVLSSGRWRYKIGDGDRVRFHFLTKGGDALFACAKFHQIGVYPNGNEVLCLHAFTQGVESCQIHSQQMGESLRNRFGCWIWVDHILHLHDNPDEAQDSWPQVKVKTVAGGERIMFKEIVENTEEEPMKKAEFLRLAAGKGQAVFAQFTNAWMTSGDLRKGLYELHRQGGDKDTIYTLTKLKDDPLPPEVLERQDIQALPTVESIFRESLYFTPSVEGGDGVLGSDSLDSGDKELPSVEETTDPMSSVSDDLI